MIGENIFKFLSPCRLDDIIRTKADSEYSRLAHYNKGLKLLKESLASEKMQHKGKPVILSAAMHIQYQKALFFWYYLILAVMQDVSNACNTKKYSSKSAKLGPTI